MTSKEELMKRVEEVWKDPNYDDLLELVGDLTKYIKENL